MYAFVQLSRLALLIYPPPPPPLLLLPIQAVKPGGLAGTVQQDVSAAASAFSAGSAEVAVVAGREQGHSNRSPSARVGGSGVVAGRGQCLATLS